MRQVKSRLPQVERLRLEEGWLVATVDVRWFDVGMDASMDGVWSLATAEGLDPGMIGLWKANGLRCGVVGAERLAALGEAVPGVFASGRSVVPMSGAWRPLSRAPRNAEGVVLRWHGSVDGQGEALRLPPGVFRLLGRVVVEGGEVVGMVLVPQHHWREAWVVPRLPTERVLEGRVFDEAALRVTLRGGDRLVIGLSAGDVEDVEEIGEGSIEGENGSGSGDGGVGGTVDFEQGEASSASEGSESGRADNSVGEVNDIGRQLLMASRLGRPVQRVLMVSVVAESEVGEGVEGAVDDRADRRRSRKGWW